MHKLFFYDVDEQIDLSYEDVLKKINASQVYMHNLTNCSVDVYFCNLLKGIILNESVRILDQDFSESEAKHLVGDEQLNVEKEFKVEFSSVEDMINAISNSTATLEIFTSGTTGKPKKIRHRVSHFVNAARITDSHKKDVWGYAFNPTHMAGLQVFFQALLNQNPMINLFKYSKSNVTGLVNDYLITHISASPSFYRSLLPANFICNSVKRITLGGEKSSKELIDNLNKTFPNARINNIYASTEVGAALISKGDRFQIPESKSEFIKIEDGELKFHKSIVGEFDFEGDWFSSGDLVEVLSENPIEFKFVSRKGILINVGGYNVDPNEVNACLINIEGVLDAKVYGRKNKMIGNLLMADVLKDHKVELTEKDILAHLRDKLQSHKVPRIIKFVDKIELSRTGKK